MDLVLFWTVFRSVHVVRLVFVVSYSACSNKVGFPVDCYISIYIYQPLLDKMCCFYKYVFEFN